MVSMEPFAYHETKNIDEHNQMAGKINELVADRNATANEVNAVRQTVDTALADANEAKSDSATALATASEAKSDSATALATVSEAKSDSATALATASEAKTEVVTAQQTADALKGRMDDAESAIAIRVSNHVFNAHVANEYLHKTPDDNSKLSALPLIASGDAGKVLTVNEDASGYENKPVSGRTTTTYTDFTSFLTALNNAPIGSECTIHSIGDAAQNIYFEFIHAVKLTDNKWASTGYVALTAADPSPTGYVTLTAADPSPTGYYPIVLFESNTDNIACVVIEGTSLSTFSLTTATIIQNANIITFN